MARASNIQAPETTVAPDALPVIGPSARWGISLSIILGSLTSSVMMGSVNVALPAMMTNLRADITQIQWVLTAFMIARTVMMPTIGWAGGRLGNRQLYLTTLSVYIAASMLCGLAWNLPSMIAFRVLQGIGAGYLFPLAMTILHETYPPGQRGMAMGIFMAGMSFGPAIGPALGGYLVDHLSWRAVFYINLPIGVVALLAAATTLPEGGRRQSRELDLLGLITMASFVVTLLMAVSQARNHGWGSSYILSLLAIASGSLVAFIIIELTCPAPLVNLQIFTNLPFILGAVVTFFVSFTNFAMNFVVALFLQRGLGFNAQHAGEIMIPAAFVWGLTSFFTGRLSDKVEGRWLIVGGSLLLCVVFYGFVAVDAWSSTWMIALLLMGRSLARGFIQSPLVTTVMAALPDHQVRIGAGLRGLLNSLGATFGIGLAGFFLQQRLLLQTQVLWENQHIAPMEHTHLVAQLQLRLWQAGELPMLLPRQVDALLQRWLLQEATTTAYHDMFVLTATVVFFTTIPVLWLRHHRPG